MAGLMYKYDKVFINYGRVQKIIKEQNDTQSETSANAFKLTEGQISSGIGNSNG